VAIFIFNFVMLSPTTDGIAEQDCALNLEFFKCAWKFFTANGSRVGQKLRIGCGKYAFCKNLRTRPSKELRLFLKINRAALDIILILLLIHSAQEIF
jgi:hypothetical protein